MKEKDRRLRKGIKNPAEMLLEARDGLTKCRELFILSTLMLMSNPAAKEELVLWGNIWFNASSEEERITRELVVPAKLKTGAFRTVPAVEDRVRQSASKFTEEVFDLKPGDALRLAKAIVNPHINFTKKIQEGMGVPENTVDVKKPEAGRIHTIFVHKPIPRKVAC